MFARTKPPPAAGTSRPLDHATRAHFEPRFGRDFGDVRVHTGADANASARAFYSLAYTRGTNIVMSDEAPAPTTAPGRRLLAHELAHVVQQDGADDPPLMRHAEASAGGLAGSPISRPGDPLEQEADRAAEMVEAGRPAIPTLTRRSAPTIQRQVAPASQSHTSNEERVRQMARRFMGGPYQRLRVDGMLRWVERSLAWAGAPMRRPPEPDPEHPHPATHAGPPNMIALHAVIPLLRTWVGERVRPDNMQRRFASLNGVARGVAEAQVNAAWSTLNSMTHRISWAGFDGPLTGGIWDHYYQTIRGARDFLIMLNGEAAITPMVEALNRETSTSLWRTPLLLGALGLASMGMGAAAIPISNALTPAMLAARSWMFLNPQRSIGIAELSADTLIGILYAGGIESYLMGMLGPGGIVMGARWRGVMVSGRPSTPPTGADTAPQPGAAPTISTTGANPIHRPPPTPGGTRFPTVTRLAPNSSGSPPRSASTPTRPTQRGRSLPHAIALRAAMRGVDAVTPMGGSGQQLPRPAITISAPQPSRPRVPTMPRSSPSRGGGGGSGGGDLGSPRPPNSQPAPRPLPPLPPTTIATVTGGQPFAREGLPRPTSSLPAGEMRGSWMMEPRMMGSRMPTMGSSAMQAVTPSLIDFDYTHGVGERGIVVDSAEMQLGPDEVWDTYFRSTFYGQIPDGEAQGSILVMIQNAPDFAASLGFARYGSAFVSMVRSPSTPTLNRRLAANQANLRFYTSLAGTLPPAEYSEQWGEGRLPVAWPGFNALRHGTNRYFHDINAHWVYLALPNDIIVSSGRLSRMLTAVLRSPTLSRNPQIIELASDAQRSISAKLDSDTVSLAGDLLVLGDSHRPAPTGAPTLTYSAASPARDPANIAARLSALGTARVNGTPLRSGRDFVEYIRGQVDLSTAEQLELNALQHRFDDTAANYLDAAHELLRRIPPPPATAPPQTPPDQPPRITPPRSGP